MGSEGQVAGFSSAAWLGGLDGVSRRLGTAVKTFLIMITIEIMVMTNMRPHQAASAGGGEGT